MPDAFVDWLAATPLSVAIGAHDWVTPGIQTVHILAIAVILAAVLMTNLRALGVVGADQTLQQTARTFAPWLIGALAALLGSGGILVVGEPQRSLQSPVFFLKMSLLLAALTLTAAIQAPLRRDAEFWAPAARRIALRGIAIGALALWAAIVFAGRWIAYAGS